MKPILMLLLSLLFMDNSCAQKINEDAISIEYTIASRGGSFKSITITKEDITTSKKRGKKSKSNTYKNTNWDNIIAALKHIDTTGISNLKAPTNKRLHDGAPIANLKLRYQDKTYNVPSFDHGTPHPEIANLVKEILSITQNIE